jgi:hypothetical protein
MEASQDATYEKFKKFMEESQCRYLPGYRHYESYNHYQLKFPNATLDEYHHDMNREVTYEEFNEMFVQHIRLMIENDELYRRQLQSLSPHASHIEEFIASNEFRF